MYYKRFYPYTNPLHKMVKLTMVIIKLAITQFSKHTISVKLGFCKLYDLKNLVTNFAFGD